MIDVVLTGVGGQSIGLASKIISMMSIQREWNSVSYDTNPWVRPGQSWTTFVRIPDEDENPLPPFVADGKAQVIIAFDPYEAARALHFLSRSGTLVTAMTPIQPVPSPFGLRHYDPRAVLQEIEVTLYNAVAHNLSKGHTMQSGQPRVIPVADETFIKSLGNNRNILVSVLLAEAIRIGCLPFTVKELCEAINSCVRPEYAELNLQAVGLVMSA